MGRSAGGDVDRAVCDGGGGEPAAVVQRGAGVRHRAAVDPDGGLPGGDQLDLGGGDGGAAGAPDPRRRALGGESGEVREEADPRGDPGDPQAGRRH